jgi:hypothetical protein
MEQLRPMSPNPNAKNKNNNKYPLQFQEPSSLSSPLQQNPQIKSPSLLLLSSSQEQPQPTPLPQPFPSSVKPVTVSLFAPPQRVRPPTNQTSNHATNTACHN